MKRLLLLLVMCAGAFTMLGLGLDRAEAVVPNCEDFLVPSIYACDVRDENGGFHQDCFTFDTSIVSDFRLRNSVFNDDYSCSCRAKGTATAPHFDESKDFLCVFRDTFGTGAREAYVGKITGTTVSGEIVTLSGFSFTFKCRRVPAC